MNLFNRIAMSVILLAFIVAVLVVSLIPEPTIQVLAQLVQSANQGLEEPFSRLFGAIVGLVVALGAFLLLLTELRPPSRRSVVVAKTAGGTAELAVDSVALRVKAVAEAVPGVREAIPVIHSRGQAVDVTLRLIASQDIDIPRKSEEIMQAVRTETEQKMGVPVKDLKITVRHGPGDRMPPAPASVPKVPPKP